MVRTYQRVSKQSTKAQKAGNFYANALLSTLYGNGLGVEFDEKKSINLLKDVEDVDPIAAYRLSYYYFSNGNPQKAIELLEYAATNEVKDAQKDLVLVYTNGQYIEPNDEKALFYDTNLEGVDLSKSDLSDAVLSHSNINVAKMNQVTLGSKLVFASERTINEFYYFENILYTFSMDNNSYQAYDILTGTLLQDFAKPTYYSFSVLSNEMVAFGFQDRIEITDIKTNKCLFTIKTKKKVSWISNKTTRQECVYSEDNVIFYNHSGTNQRYIMLNTWETFGVNYTYFNLSLYKEVFCWENHEIYKIPFAGATSTQVQNAGRIIRFHSPIVSLIEIIPTQLLKI